MPTLSFDGETHGEIVLKVRRWLASLDGNDDTQLSPSEAIEQGAELTKDALRIIASAAPGPIAQSELLRGLTNMGYKATDATKSAMMSGLDSIEEATGGSVVKQVRNASRRAAYEMNATVARQVLKTLRGG